MLPVFQAPAGVQKASSFLVAELPLARRHIAQACRAVRGKLVHAPALAWRTTRSAGGSADRPPGRRSIGRAVAALVALDRGRRSARG